MGAESHYFDSAPTSRSRTSTVALTVDGRDLSLGTDTGVFSSRRLDPGTAVLLDTVPRPPQVGDLLDLGCGYGPITVSLAVQAPGSMVWAIDVNERARALTAANAETAGLGNVRVCEPDDVPADTRFAVIWGNPPIRVGKDALHALLTRWLDRLAEGGAAYLVVQKHLGADSLQRWLSYEGWPTEKVRSRKAFRVLKARARRPE